ncbi:cbb3-type cytochrome c oxidase N-terminal domain-containing protein [Melioribacteraceae bacterium 4301-Me]|uniref:cbb3-type cytochrome c oxidase N-terminal domain-containing protein n=1 Tax=Pyranulibacter aquaticus TaxID=3163344 RepID=UPI00359BE06C
MRAIDKFYKLFFFFLYFFSSASLLFAQNNSTEESVMKTMLIITIIVIALILWFVVVYSEKNDSEGKAFIAPLIAIKNWLTKSTPIEKEQEILMKHDYDGIRELDNKIPPWFNLLFYGTILFSIIYMLKYHVFSDGKIQETEYKIEMEQANLQKHILTESGALITEETVTLLTDAASLQEGKEIFTKNCVSCHGPEGGGLVGPNLTDDYWIHGGGIKNIFKTIKYGVPQKGMISWQTQLDPKKIQEVASYVISLHGTNPSNAKPPEGQKWVETSDSTSNKN